MVVGTFAYTPCMRTRLGIPSATYYAAEDLIHIHPFQADKYYRRNIGMAVAYLQKTGATASMSPISPMHCIYSDHNRKSILSHCYIPLIHQLFFFFLWQLTEKQQHIDQRNQTQGVVRKTIIIYCMFPRVHPR